MVSAIIRSPVALLQGIVLRYSTILPQPPQTAAGQSEPESFFVFSFSLRQFITQSNFTTDWDIIDNLQHVLEPVLPRLNNRGL